ncbi:MAG: hypothetical protein IT512_01815 [Rhodocyclaceae bacterium]|nr:hypothetical protein [Rhodocyclaceae bacterium]
MRSPRMKSRSAQHGVSIVTAIVLIVILAALAAYSVTVFQSQQSAAALDVLGVRAYQAAQAGLEWGSWNALRNPPRPAPPAPDVPPACPPSPTTLVMPAGTTLAAFTVTVTCGLTSHGEAGETVTLYTFTSTACNLAGPGGCPNPAAPANEYVERQVQARVERR